MTFKPWSISAFSKRGCVFLHGNELENIVCLNESVTLLISPHLDDVMRSMEALPGRQSDGLAVLRCCRLSKSCIYIWASVNCPSASPTTKINMRMRLKICYCRPGFFVVFFFLLPPLTSHVFENRHAGNVVVFFLSKIILGLLDQKKKKEEEEGEIH